jgi:C4-type Zn-finger protein
MQDQLNEFSNETGCPKCGNKIITPVKYTWWGGVLGPRLFHHTKCESCGYRFNSKTGRSNTPAIIIYSFVIFIIAFAAFYFLRTI